MYQLRYVPQAAEGYAAGTGVLRCWHAQMLEMLSGDHRDEHCARTSTVWQQGFMELSVGIDEWEAKYMVLGHAQGLLIFASQAARRRGEPEREVAPGAILRAVRSTGLEYFEWGLHVHLAGDELLEVRAPSRGEMHPCMVLAIYTRSVRNAPDPFQAGAAALH